MTNRMDGSAGQAARANGPSSAPSTPMSPVGPPLSPDELTEKQQSSLTDVTQMWINFAKTFAIIFPIYVLGYFEFSFSWVLIGLAMLFYWRKNYGNRDYRVNRALAFLEHEEKVERQSVPTTELPPWVRPKMLCSLFYCSCGCFAFPFSRVFSQATSTIGCLPRWLTWMTNFPASSAYYFFFSFFLFCFSTQST